MYIKVTMKCTKNKNARIWLDITTRIISQNGFAFVVLTCWSNNRYARFLSDGVTLFYAWNDRFAAVSYLGTYMLTKGCLGVPSHTLQAASVVACNVATMMWTSEIAWALARNLNICLYACLTSYSMQRQLNCILTSVSHEYLQYLCLCLYGCICFGHWMLIGHMER